MNERRQQVRTKVGDVVAIHAHHLGEPERLGSADHVHFRVRWDDNRESIFYPGSDATVRVRRQKREVKKP